MKKGKRATQSDKEKEKKIQESSSTENSESEECESGEKVKLQKKDLAKKSNQYSTLNENNADCETLTNKSCFETKSKNKMPEKKKAKKTTVSDISHSRKSLSNQSDEATVKGESGTKSDSSSDNDVIGSEETNDTEDSSSDENLTTPDSYKKQSNKLNNQHKTVVKRKSGEDCVKLSENSGEAVVKRLKLDFNVAECDDKDISFLFQSK